MTDRLTDEQVVSILLAPKQPSDAGWNEYTGPNLEALAREVQEYRCRRCDGCEHWDREHAPPSSGWCSALDGILTPPTFACNAWQSKAGL